MINIANFLTILRFFLVFVMIYFFLPLLDYTILFEEGLTMGIAEEIAGHIKEKKNLFITFFISLVCYTVASITDLLDGILARKYNQITKIGTFLDPLADKALVLSFFFLVYLYSPVSYFLIFFIVISFREIAITVLRIYTWSKKTKLKTEKHGKLKTNVQIIVQYILWAMILVTLLIKKENIFAKFLPYLSNGLLLITSGITVYSGISYFKK